MNILFKTGENYYSGFQRFNILTDRTFRRCLIAFFLLIAVQAPMSIVTPPGMFREIFFILMFLAYMLPAALVLAGGMPAAGWRWYAAAAGLYAAGTIPIAIGGSYFYLLFTLPAMLCFMMANRTAPHLLVALGYKTPAMPATEVAYTILIAAVFISYTWLGQALIKKSGFEIHSTGEYLWLIATSALYYGTLWGILYGIFLRRFLDMRYEIVAPIALNIILMSMYWVPSVIGYSVNPKLAVSGSILQSFASQLALGMAFYFCRSTRPLLAGFIIYYLFVKSINF